VTSPQFQKAILNLIPLVLGNLLITSLNMCLINIDFLLFFYLPVSVNPFIPLLFLKQAFSLLVFTLLLRLQDSHTSSVCQADTAKTFSCPFILPLSRSPCSCT